jgi:hypothetical protein
MNTRTGDASDGLLQSNVPFWHAPWEFAVHALVGTSIFGIIATPAVCLDLAIRELDVYGIGQVIIVGLQGAEYSLLGTDLMLFGVFLWRTAQRTLRRL